jgi:hypothetical protein
MANLIAFQSGNFNAANFKNADTATSSAQTSHTFSNFTTTTTSLVFSPTFSGTNGATNDGVLIFVGRVSASSTGTFTVGLSSNGTSNNLASCTVNVSDIPLLNNSNNAGTQNVGQGHWMFFKWASGVVLASGTNYQLTVTSSSAGSVQVWRSATTADWTRLLRLSSSTATPAAADVTYIAGEYTAGNTFSAFTITIDTTTAISTSYGAMIIGNQATVQFGSTTFTDYKLKLSGNIEVYSGGVFTMGTSGTPIPETTNVLMEFQSASAAQFGLSLYGGTFTSFGAKTGIVGGRNSAAVSNKALTSNVATLTTSVVHGFTTGDTVVITGVDSTFNGTFTIASTPTTTTFTYSKVAANVGSTAVSPLGMATTTTTISNKALTSNVATLTTAATHGFTVNSQTVTNKALFNNLATLTTSAAHGFQIGNQVYINIGDATFDGLQTVNWCPTSTTFQFTKTAANVTSTGASGTATVGPQVIVAGVDSTFNGTYNILTVPSTTTFTYVKVAGDVGSTGASGTATLIKERYVRLAADRASGGAACTFTNGTGWSGSDQIEVASTTRTSSESELRTIGQNSGSSCTVTSNFSNTHSGTTTAMTSTPNQDIRAEVLLMSRNVKMGGTSTSNTCYVFADSTSTINCSYTEFYNWGTNSTDRFGMTSYSGTGGLTNGSLTVLGCYFHETANNAYGVLSMSNTGDFFSVTQSNFANLGSAGIHVATTTGTGFTFDQLAAIRCGNAQTSHGLFNMSDQGFSTSNCISVACNRGITPAENSITQQVGTHTNWVIHSSDGIGMDLSQAGNNGIFQYFSCWRNNSNGLDTQNTVRDYLITNVHLFGNSTNNIATGSRNENMTWRNLYVDAGTTLAATVGWVFVNATSNYNCKIENAYFGVNQNHSTADWSFNNASQFHDIKGNNVAFSSPTVFNNFSTSSINEATRIGITRYGATAGNHRTILLYGTIQSDTTRFKTASPSEQLLPTAFTTTWRLRLESSPKRCAINSGNNTTVSVWVRTSVSGDGAAYNGSRARLILKCNTGAGIPDDIILATATSASDGNWELLSATTPTVTDDAVLEFCVDCNGTAGWINVDDWAVT